MFDAQTILFKAAGVCDATGINHRPGVVVVRDGCVAAVGAAAEASHWAQGRYRLIELPVSLILPALVNAHAHLDLSLIGPTRFEGDFEAWLSEVKRRRPTDPAQVAAAVGAGLEQSVAAGVGFVGDIAASTAAISARANWRGVRAVGGVSYLECFGIGRRQARGFIDLVTRLRSLPAGLTGGSGAADFQMGIQPHSPYSAGPALYTAVGRYAAERNLRLCTHLAETEDEIVFVRDASGPLADLLRRLDKWDDSIRPTGLHPIAALAPALRLGSWLLAHCNYMDHPEIQTLAALGASVAYCPRASEYFGHPRTGKHPYQQMLDAGVNVALGTDSILCQDAAESQPLGILPQMRLLYRRDAADPLTLLRMASVNGLRAMGLDEGLATLQVGTPASLTAARVDPRDPTDLLVQVLRSNAPIQPLIEA